MFLTSANAKEPTNIKITSNSEQNGSRELSAILTDLNDIDVKKQ